MTSLRRCNSLCPAFFNFTRPQSISALIRRPSYSTYHARLEQEIAPLRKQLKEEAKRLKREAKLKPAQNGVDLSQWELTVGLEIHAELNTSRKLFSDAFASSGLESQPNSNVALFDLAYPGSQPHFQYATLLPALRAALVLNCKIQRRSGWDRKHYFYQDQPNGYQITQYYGVFEFVTPTAIEDTDIGPTEPFARDGHVTLFRHDGIAPEDGESITVGITQVQMEQDTAKTIMESPSDHLLDFNRVSHPLIEIITLPHIHHPSTAAACVRKIQSILKSVDACVAGMEIGGLRADVNVSVRRRNADGDGVQIGVGEYRGVTGLGKRTEIKNLSSFKAVEDAIVAERDRQIRVLESGGVIEGETRRWTLGSTETQKLRGKEGDVDYRYMPDPDLEPLVISDELVDYLRKDLPPLADDTLTVLTKAGLTIKDAQTLLADEVDRLEYFFDVVEILGHSDLDITIPNDLGRIVGNWVLHELGALFTKSESSWSVDRVHPSKLADLLRYLLTDKITTRSAKQLLELIFYGDPRNVDTIVQDENMLLQNIPEEEYEAIAKDLIQHNAAMVQAIKTKGQQGKVMWFVGQTLRKLGQSAQAEKAKQIVCRLLDVPVESGAKPKRK